MPIALTLHAVRKRFVVGTAGCIGSVEALRGVSASLCTGEAATLVGGAGAGKSTLLLCAAGLLGVDSGEIRWFGDDDRSAGCERATYYFAGGLARGPSSRRSHTEPHIHLVDGPESLGLATTSRIAGWIDRRRSAGDAVLVATRSSDLACELAPRTIVLRGGRSYAEDHVAHAARVAETIEWGHR